MTILSIDPAVSKKIAYALFVDEQLQYYGAVDQIYEIDDVINTALDIDLVVTEDMYLGKNVQTLKQLCYVVGGILYLCQIYDIEYRLIAPVTWKSHHGLLKKSAKLEEKLEIEIIRQATGEEITDVDIRAAILIGLCQIEKARWKKL